VVIAVPSSSVSADTVSRRRQADGGPLRGCRAQVILASLGWWRRSSRVTKEAHRGVPYAREERSGPLNVHDILNTVAEEWSPQVVATVNNYDIKIANVSGEFPSHRHEDTDEFFLVLRGTFELHLGDSIVTLNEGDVYTVPRGVDHAPHAASGTRILMVEPRGTVNTGDPETGTGGTRLV
jgi:mannose-6-phosphate isomerase-like protein (cupin superfamily)